MVPHYANTETETWSCLSVLPQALHAKIIENKKVLKSCAPSSLTLRRVLVVLVVFSFSVILSFFFAASLEPAKEGAELLVVRLPLIGKPVALFPRFNGSLVLSLLE